LITWIGPIVITGIGVVISEIGIVIVQKA